MPLRPQPRLTESITVLDFLEKGQRDLQMTVAEGERGLKNLIKDKSINRPALALTGYFRNFAARRIQLFGAGEMAYLRDQSTKRQAEIVQQIIDKKIPCMVLSRGLQPVPAMRKLAAEKGIPLLRSTLNSRDFMASATLLLEDLFAPRIVEHGTLMDIKGIGVLIRGDSGMGKSECALALIERGHSLAADDIIYIKLVDEHELVGTSSELNRGYMECRGIGIINIAELFGIRAVRLNKRIDMVVSFVEWKPGLDEERTGLEMEYFEILGQKVPQIRLPVRPGRDLARLVEVAALVQALKNLGHDTAQEFNDRLIEFMTKGQ